MTSEGRCCYEYVTIVTQKRQSFTLYGSDPLGKGKY